VLHPPVEIAPKTRRSGAMIGTSENDPKRTDLGGTMKISARDLVRVCTVLAMFAVAGRGACQDSVRRAVAIDPVTGIIDALKTHQIVALGDVHGNVQLQELRLKLIRDPRFPAAVNDIVVEGGNPKHQDVMDKYVNGGDASHEDLARAWSETAFGTSTCATCETFYQTIRDVNAKLPGSQRIRVVLGEPTPLTMTAEAELIRREVIAKGRNALLIYGEMHFVRKPIFYPLSDAKFSEFIFTHPDAVSTVVHLEAAGVTVFSVFAQARDDFVRVQPDIASWPTPSLTVVNGTRLGVEPFATFVLKDTLITVPDADGNGVHQEHPAADPARSGLTQEQVDALLVLSPWGN
jgi:hypothetical protein